MKKLLHGLTGLIFVLLPLVWGSVLIYSNGFNTDLRDAVFQTVQDSPFYGQGIGAVLILLVLLYLMTIGPTHPKSRYISFDSENGSVSISVNAVRDYVRKIGDEFSEIASLDPRIRPEKDLISVDLNVEIQAGTRIPELSKLLQNRVRESIRDGLGIAEVREIKVKVQKIVGVLPPAVT